MVRDEGCIGPSGKLLCLCQAPKMYSTHAWHHSTHMFDCWADPGVHLLLVVDVIKYFFGGNLDFPKIKKLNIVCCNI